MKRILTQKNCNDFVNNVCDKNKDMSCLTCPLGVKSSYMLGYCLKSNYDIANRKIKEMAYNKMIEFKLNIT